MTAEASALTYRHVYIDSPRRTFVVFYVVRVRLTTSDNDSEIRENIAKHFPDKRFLNGFIPFLCTSRFSVLCTCIFFLTLSTFERSKGFDVESLLGTVFILTPSLILVLQSFT